MKTETDIVQQIADRLDEVLRRGYVPTEKQLWSAEDVAAYLGVTKRTVAERYAPLPSFPKARQLPSTGRRGLLRWSAKEIMDWAHRLDRSA